jgi:outer membrane receptor protein involved in Fe transport
VEVEGAAPLVNTVSSEQAQSFDRNTVLDLPLARRNFSSILTVGTGVTQGGGGSGSGIRLNGVGRHGTAFSVDGTEASANPEGRSAQTFGSANYVDIMSLEAIEEVHTVKGVLPAEYSGALGGQINVLTRSGTNEWHGSLFENFQSDSLNARDPFLATKPGFTYNQFGGSAGGPVKRDRIFVFAAYEGYREERFTRVDGDVPTQFMRDMAIKAVPAYAEPLKYLPLPNQPHGAEALTGRYISARSRTSRDNHLDTKGDFRLGDTSNLAVTYSRGRPFRLTPRIDLDGANDQDLQVYSDRATVSYVTGGATWTSETRYGYNRNNIERVDGIFTIVDPVNPNEEIAYGRRLGRLNPSVLGWSTAGGEIVLLQGPTWTLGEKFSLHAGEHSLKFGAQYSHHCCQRANTENVVWAYSSLQDFLGNIPSNINASFGNGEYNANMAELGFFIQDDWRISSKLTLNLGLRYDYFGHIVADEVNNSGSFLVNPDGLLDASFKVGPFRPADNPYESDGLNFAPRVGFAYNVDGKGGTVIRGGAGYVFSPQILGSFWQSVGTEFVPKRVVFSRQDALDYGLKYPLYNDDLAKVVEQQAKEKGFTNIFSAVNPEIQNPYSLQYSLGIQRELTSSLVLETGFVGVRGTKFIMFRPLNQPDRTTGLRPNPTLRANFYADESQNSSYVSWQTSFRKRYSSNLSGSFHYTWGKSLANNGGDPGAYYQGDNDARNQEFFDLRAERGPAVGDITHNVSAEWVYDLPAFSNLGNSVARQILGNWQMSGIFSAATGEPLGITQSSSHYHARPDYIGGETVLDNYQDTRQYLNTAAFTRVPIVQASGALARPGNLGWGAVRGPGRWNLDFSVGKNFPLTERLRLQLRSDMLNVFNHVNLTGLSTSINSGTFGRLQSTTGSRVIQLNGRITW